MKYKSEKKSEPVFIVFDNKLKEKVRAKTPNELIENEAKSKAFEKNQLWAQRSYDLQMRTVFNSVPTTRTAIPKNTNSVPTMFNSAPIKRRASTVDSNDINPVKKKRIKTIPSFAELDESISRSYK